MRRCIFSLVAVFILAGCASTVQYTWQDEHGQDREDFSADLDECRSYTARQYKPGTPTGEPYLEESQGSIGETDEQSGEWRPDRSPFKTTNVNALPRHEIPVGYTGYPGELDYYPHYLDEILEKCMKDRGWGYLPVTESD